ncbi:hypothetical protein BDD12DRAFT_893132 [Trichophaea hybrida]|nr:hypothetical protein BDD12DRAFT_893132 [Trichophaea hybrida]
MSTEVVAVQLALGITAAEHIGILYCLILVLSYRKRSIDGTYSETRREHGCISETSWRPLGLRKRGNRAALGIDIQRAVGNNVDGNATEAIGNAEGMDPETWGSRYPEMCWVCDLEQGPSE